jgi:molybdenum cofactor cytidylyltransferase
MPIITLTLTLRVFRYAGRAAGLAGASGVFFYRVIGCRPLLVYQEREQGSTMDRKISGMLLAAGESTRMGSPKQLLVFDGEILIVRILRLLLSAPLHEIIVVLGHQAQAVREAITFKDARVRYTVNDRFNEGMSSSIKKGMECLAPDSEGVLISLVDHPWIKHDTISGLVHRWAQNGRGIALPRFGERRGHPVIFGSPYFQELRDLSEAPGARAIMHRHPDDILEVTTDDEAVILDVDTPGDLVMLKERFKCEITTGREEEKQ